MEPHRSNGGQLVGRRIGGGLVEISSIPTSTTACRRPLRRRARGWHRTTKPAGDCPRRSSGAPPPALVEGTTGARIRGAAHERIRLLLRHGRRTYLKIARWGGGQDIGGRRSAAPAPAFAPRTGHPHDGGKGSAGDGGGKGGEVVTVRDEWRVREQSKR